MNIIFFGTPIQAKYIVAGLEEKGVEIKAVVTRPDKPVKRSKKPMPSAVKSWAIDKQIPILQPTKLSDPEFLRELEEIDADCFVVTAYGALLPQVLLDMPRLGCINVHPSLLPKYRGAAPIPRSIINGDEETGVSIMQMVMKMDAGAVYKVEKLSIDPNETCEELEERIWPLGARLMYEVLCDVYKNNLNITPQNEDLVTFAPKLSQEMAQLDWNQPGLTLHNLIRGLSPKPGAWTEIFLKGQLRRVKIFNTMFLSGSEGNSLGSLGTDPKGHLTITCKDGQLVVKELQIEGKKRMPSAQFLKGASLEDLKLNLTV